MRKSASRYIKYVPSECMNSELKALGEKLYQYIAIDEFTTIRHTMLIMNIVQ